MQDIYAALMGEPVSEEEKMQALARKLATQRSMGQTGQILGGRMLEKPSAQVIGAADKSAEELAGFSARKRELTAQEEMRAASALERAKQDELQRQFTAGENAKERALRLSLEQMRQKDMDAREARAEAKLTAAEKKEMDRYTRALQSDLDKSNVPFLDSAFKDLETALSPFIDEKTGTPKKDVPGIGATSLTPMGLLSKEGRPVRQAVANVRNQFLKMASGAAVTNPEAARLYEQIAMQLGGSDEDVLRGLESLKQMRDSAKSNIYAGYDPEVVETYETRRGQIFPGSWGGQSAGAAPAAAAPATTGILSPEEWKAQKAAKGKK